MTLFFFVLYFLTQSFIQVVKVADNISHDHRKVDLELNSTRNILKGELRVCKF